MTLTNMCVEGKERGRGKWAHMIRNRFGLVAVGCLIWSAGPPSAVAQNPANPAQNTTYLALGDSLAFGFNPFVNPPDASKYVGYPAIISIPLNLNVANASCPGETSNSFVNTGAALPGFTCGANPTATVFGTSGPVSVPIPLFVPYNGAISQLEYAAHYLNTNPNPKLVTINIGGNDLAPLLTCTSGCDVLAATLLNNLANNLAVIYSTIRGSGYAGPIIAANYYAFNFKDPLQVGPSGAFTALNATIAFVTTLPQFGGKVADVFGAFQAFSGGSGDPCRAGLLLKIPNSNACDTHPSRLGQAVIAAAVAFQFQNQQQQ